MRILAINCGSSSLKSALIETDDGRRLADAHIEDVSDYEDAVRAALQEMQVREVSGVAHRVVHGGTHFVQPTRIDEKVARALEGLSELAPLHNPPALEGIRAVRALLPNVPHVAVFDTAFHATLPKHAYTYALPTDVCERLGIRRFGFHGTSHAFVAQVLARHLGTAAQNLRIVSCHLGNGSSVTAIEHGRSVETSMGMTPLEGLVMGTRGGDIDPGVLLHILQHGGRDAASLDELLNRHCGLEGLTGTHDLREIEQRASRGDARCELALDVFAHRARKYIGAYAAVMGGVDLIAFTGGIGEHSASMRDRICRRFEFLGAALDPDRNRHANVHSGEPIAEISTAAAGGVRIFVVRADEELAIAREAAALLRSM